MKLSGNISHFMPVITKMIEGSAYNNLTPVLAFRHKDWRVIIYRREIMVKEIKGEEDAFEVVNYLKDLVEKSVNETGE